MQPQEQLHHLIHAFLKLVDPLSHEELALPTPCTDWTVRDLLGHMTEGAFTFAGALRGDALSDPAPDIIVAIRDALHEFAAALDAPGAFARKIGGLPFGDFDGETLARYAAFDLLMHSWDLAMASGRPLNASEEVVGSVDVWARGWLVQDYRRPGMFAAETNAHDAATKLERLVAFSGRDLEWSAAGRSS